MYQELKMSEEEPTEVYDVVIHEKWEQVYRVAFFGKVPEDWLKEWPDTFYPIEDLAGHAAHIAQTLHRINGLTMVEGYGPITWLPHNWRRVAIWTPEGEEIAFAAVKLINARNPTKRYDYVTTEGVNWEGFDVYIDK
jgi:hypothetical protein